MTGKRWSHEASAARAWWASLQPQAGDGRVRPGDRAALARLRRAASIIEAMVEPATADLHRRMGLITKSHSPQRSALLAAVLAHVRSDNPATTVAGAIGKARGGGASTPLISPLRFKRLVAAREPDDVLVVFRRLAAILDHTANVGDLARLLLTFTDPDERHADIARVCFAFDYHGARQYAPDTDDARKTATTEV
jgi:CRISPR system Cascade subunit CasB